MRKNVFPGGGSSLYPIDLWEGEYNTDHVDPLNNIIAYSQIIDPIVKNKNMYYEICVTVCQNTLNDNKPYKSWAMVCMGDMYRNKQTPCTGYGVLLKNNVSTDYYYDLYTAQFNNDYGAQGINSVTIPYASGGSGLGYTMYYVGVGWNYQTKQLFYHINPTLYGDQYGLAIDNVEFPENTRIYLLGIDVDKMDFKQPGMSYPLSIRIMTSGFIYQNVADKYLS